MIIKTIEGNNERGTYAFVRPFFIFLIIYICAIFEISLFSKINAQNLVSNGDFESYSFRNGRDSIFGNSSIMYSWFPSKFPYYNRVVDPEHKFRIQPHSGYGMICGEYIESCPFFNKTGCTNYNSTKLIKNLEVGKLYKVNLWIYPENNGIIDNAVLRNIGLLLTNRIVKTPDPHGVIENSTFFNGSLKFDQWNKIEIIIRPLCLLDYVYIGLFKTKSFPKFFRPIEDTFYYFVDDVCVEEIKEENVDSSRITNYCPYPLVIQEKSWRED
ncbi:MAG: hypothetical protein ABIO44_07970, partial [Saprospiraceae bacterium]